MVSDKMLLGSVTKLYMYFFFSCLPLVSLRLFSLDFVTLRNGKIPLVDAEKSC